MTKAAVVSIDPFDPAFIEDPYPHHDALRDAGPVLWMEAIGTYGVARFAEVSAVLSDPLTFISSRGVGHADISKADAFRPASLLVETDPPLHERTRSLMNRIVSPRAIKEMRARWEAAAEELMEELVARGAFDAAVDLGEAFPLKVFPDTIGMRADGRRNLLPYADAIFNNMGPHNAAAIQSFAASQEAVVWVAESCRRDRLSPSGWGAQVYEAADRGECTFEEAELLVRSFLSAGVDTTISGLSHLILAFAHFPDQWDKLREKPELIRKALEESLRWNSTVQVLFRTTARDVELSGVEIPEGSKVLLFYGAANRDPRRWPDPDRFDIERQTSGHLGFGYGIHQCLGQMVARMESELVLAALAKRVRTIRLAGAPVRRINNTMRAMAHLPVVVEPLVAEAGAVSIN